MRQTRCWLLVLIDWCLGNGNYFWQVDHECRATFMSAGKADGAVHLVRYQIIKNIQAKAGATFVSSRGKKRIKYLAAILFGYAATIIRKREAEAIVGLLIYVNVDGAAIFISEAMMYGIHREVGYYLVQCAGECRHTNRARAVEDHAGCFYFELVAETYDE